MSNKAVITIEDRDTLYMVENEIRDKLKAMGVLTLTESEEGYLVVKKDGTLIIEFIKD